MTRFDRQKARALVNVTKLTDLQPMKLLTAYTYVLVSTTINYTLLHKHIYVITTLLSMKLRFKVKGYVMYLQNKHEPMATMVLGSMMPQRRTSYFICVLYLNWIQNMMTDSMLKIICFHCVPVLFCNKFNNKRPLILPNLTPRMMILQ